MDRFESRTEYDRWIMEGVDYYTVCVFLGRGRYTKAVVGSLEAARQMGKAIATDRPATVYAVRDGHDAHVENIG